MQVLTKEGSLVEVSAVNADGLDAAVPTPVSFSVSGPFTVAPEADGLSAKVVPDGFTGTGTLVVTAGNLTATEDVSFTAGSTGEPSPATKLNLKFTPIAPAAPVEPPVL